MQKFSCFILSILFFTNSCQGGYAPPQQKVAKPKVQTQNIINPQESLLKNRFAPPANYQRLTYSPNSFGHYLQNLPLKKYGSLVAYFNGSTKANNDIYESVIDLPIGHKDLHQCADAVMNLWANYLFSNKKYNDIQFKFLNDKQWHNYYKWCQGKPTDANFTKFMEDVWTSANTRSLFGQLSPSSITKAKIGDVFIVTGNPYGHAIIIVDECINKTTGQKMYMLAQSYMPAQETQILQNPNNKAISPWYNFEEIDKIITPEWIFEKSDLRTFEP